MFATMKIIVVEIQEKQPTIRKLFDRGSDLNYDLRKGINVTNRDEIATNSYGVETESIRALKVKMQVRRLRYNPWVAKYGRRSRRYRREKMRMPYGDCTVNVGVWEEVKSHISLILRESGEIIYLTHRRGSDARMTKQFGESQANSTQTTIDVDDMPTSGDNQVENLFPSKITSGMEKCQIEDN